MEAEKIEDKGKTLAVIVRGGDWQEGLSFASTDKDFVQVGMWWYHKGHTLKPHIHLNAPRQITHTQEVVFVKDGRLKVDVYSDGGVYLKSVELNRGDFMILLSGGHGYEMLEENTKVLEVKNGPYVGAENDRKRI